MEIIRGAMREAADGARRVRVPVDRATLGKRRWRGVAEDGLEFGFDLEQPLADGAIIFREGKTVYAISQSAEPLLQTRFRDATNAARLGWMIGNLHFPVELEGGMAFTVDDPATRAMFEREGVFFEGVNRVFRPLSSMGHGHNH